MLLRDFLNEANINHRYWGQSAHTDDPFSEKHALTLDEV